MALCKTGKRPMDERAAYTAADRYGGDFYLCGSCGFYHHTLEHWDGMRRRPKKRGRHSRRGAGGGR